MKKLQKSLVLLGFLLSLCQLTACRSLTPEKFSYRSQSLVIRAEGSWGDTDFSCDIYCENGIWSTIVYHAPHPLAEVTVSVEENGKYSVSRDGLSMTIDESSPIFQGLIRPARVLLLDGRALTEPLSVQRLAEGDRFELSVEGEASPVTLTLRDGFPIFAVGNDFSIRIERLASSDFADI